MDEKTREAIALKKFSLISPILNGHVKKQSEYFKKICSEPVEMPHYGLKNYHPKTLQAWLLDYRRGGLEGLKPNYRSDRGKSRKVSDEVMARVQQIWAKHPRYSVTNVYEQLLKEGLITPDTLSPATFYRFVSSSKHDLLNPINKESDSKPEVKRFAHQNINELWQTDIMYGPLLKDGKTKKQTYLFGFIDDASRLFQGEFYFTQNFSALRKTFKDAVLRRGIPKLVYSDNGKVYRSGQLAVVCANLGSHLIHTKPYTPSSKGKIERIFLTVRQRFLGTLDINSIKSLDELNHKFWQWLDEDYQRKIHSALGMSPLDFFMSQAHTIKMLSDPQLLDEYFLLRVERKVKHDATLTLDKVLYETDLKLAGLRLEVRYEPEWLSQPSKPILLFHEGKQVGIARQVNFHDNAHVKRAGGKHNLPQPGEEIIPDNKSTGEITGTVPETSISFTRIMNKGGVNE